MSLNESVSSSEEKPSTNKLKDEICHNRKCISKIESKLPPIKKTTKKEDEEWCIKALPTDWLPLSKPSKAIERMNIKRQQEHEKAIREMKDNMVEVNTNIENKIRLESESIRKTFECIKQDMEKSIKNMDIDKEKWMDVDTSIFQKTLEEIRSIHDNYHIRISQFHEYLKTLEKCRSDAFKEILRKCYKQLHQISFMLPYELQQYFEHEIMRINQITLSNYRCYINICSQLQLQSESSAKSWYQTLNESKETLKCAQKKYALKKLKDLQMTSQNCNRLVENDETTRTASVIFDSRKNEINNLLSQTPQLPVTSSEVREWSIAIEDSVKSLDYSAKMLVNLYRTAIIQVFNGYFEEFQKITENMIDMGLADETEIGMFSSEVCLPIVESISMHFGNQINDLKTLWDQVINNLQNKLKSTSSFLHESARLWELHNKRKQGIETTVLQELQQIIQKNDKAVELKETKMCIAVDMLRQESTEAKLYKALQNVNTLLNLSKTAYREHYNSEVKIIDKYSKLAEEEALVFILEMRQFLNACPKTTSQRTQASLFSINEESYDFIPKKMIMCEYQVEAVHNWMIGLWDAIDNYLRSCKQEIARKAMHWSNSCRKKVAKRLEVKTAFLKTRYERVKIDIYDRRLAELRAHAERLERHKAGALKELDILTEQSNNYNEKYQQIIEEYEEKTEQILDRIRQVKVSNMARKYFCELSQTLKERDRAIAELEKAFEDTLSEKMDMISNATLAFNKSIKLFSEGGNFSFEEAKKTGEQLATFEKNFTKTFKTKTKEFDTKRIQMKRTIQNKTENVFKILKTTEEELQYKEKTVSHITELQRLIKHDVFEIKLNFKRLSANLNGLKENAYANAGKLDYIVDLKRNFTQLVDKISGIQKYLTRTDAISIAQVLNDVHLPNSIETDSGTRKRTSSARKMPLASGNDDNFKDSLYKTIRRTDNNDFISEFSKKLYKSFEELQEKAKQFYSGRDTILTRNIIPSTFSVFMSENLEKYMSYLLQGEVLWLDLVNETLKLTQRTLLFILFYSNSYLKSLFEESFDHGEQSLKETLENINKERALQQAAFLELINKLKPSLGHHENVHLLKSLNEEMEELMKRLNNSQIMEEMSKLDTEQENSKNQLAFSATSATEDFKNLKQYAFNNLTAYTLIDQFNEILKQYEQITHTEDAPIADAEQSVKLQNVDKRLKALTQTVRIPSEYKLNMTASKILMKERSVSHSRVCHSSVTDEYEDLKYTDETELLNHLTKIYANGLEDRRNETEALKEKYQDPPKWKEVWNANVQKILAIYSVKYDSAST